MAAALKYMRNQAAEHGVFFIGYWTSMWVGTGLATYGLLEMFGQDSGIELLRMVKADKVLDVWKLHPGVGNLATAMACNELLEPVRFPLAVLTVRPVHHLWNGLWGKKQSSENVPVSVWMMFKANWPISVALYSSLWLGSLGGFFWGLESGVVDPSSALSVIQAMGAEEKLQSASHYIFGDKGIDNVTMSNGIASLVLNEFVEPLRLLAMVGLYPIVKRVKNRAQNTDTNGAKS